MPPGNYALRCLVHKGEGALEQPTREELAKAIGTDDYQYYRRIQKLALASYFGVPLLFLVSGIIATWKKALLVSAIVGALCYAMVVLLSRSERCRRASRITNDLWKQAYQRGLPTFIFELRRVEETAGLKGGSVRLND